MDYEEKLLTVLAEKYRKSKKDQGTNATRRRTKVCPSQLYKNYSRNDGDMAQIEALNQAILQCHDKGFVTYETEGFSSEIQSVYLVDDRIEELEGYLAKKYGYEPKPAKRQKIENLIAAYGGHSPAADQECKKLQQALEKNRIPARYDQIEELLKALVFIETNKKELYLREASLLIYGDSKYLEENTLGSVCKSIRSCLSRPCGESELEDEILEEYHILREKQKLCLKGDVTLRMASGRELELGMFSNGIEFFADEMKQMEQIQLHTPVFTTVENYTAWLRCHRSDGVYFYLGGYAARHQRDFLKKVYSGNPAVDYRHFGDIDAGGLYIHEHLCRVTGIPFQLYRMSRRELEDTRFQPCLHPLTQQDRIRLKSLEKQEVYRELAAYMLEQNVKLEQEIISYYEY